MCPGLGVHLNAANWQELAAKRGDKAVAAASGAVGLSAWVECQKNGRRWLPLAEWGATKAVIAACDVIKPRGAAECNEH